MRMESAKIDLLARISHAVRTPMTGVVGMTGLLLETSLTPEQREYAELACISAAELLRIVDGILDYSRIQAGKVELDCASFDLPHMAKQVMGLLAHQADA